MSQILMLDIDFELQTKEMMNSWVLHCLGTLKNCLQLCNQMFVCFCLEDKQKIHWYTLRPTTLGCKYFEEVGDTAHSAFMGSSKVNWGGGKCGDPGGRPSWWGVRGKLL